MECEKMYSSDLAWLLVNEVLICLLYFATTKNCLPTGHSEKVQQSLTTILCLENDFKLPILQNSEKGNKAAFYSYVVNETYIEDV